MKKHDGRVICPCCGKKMSERSVRRHRSGRGPVDALASALAAEDNQHRKAPRSLQVPGPRLALPPFIYS